jgi:hypothetical protein
LTCLAWEALPVAYITTNIALGIICPHMPCHYAKVGIPSGGAASCVCYISVLFQHIYIYIYIYRNHYLCMYLFCSWFINLKRAGRILLLVNTFCKIVWYFYQFSLIA